MCAHSWESNIGSVLQQIFVDADINRNGVLDQAELKKAIRAAGDNINTSVLLFQHKRDLTVNV